MLILQRPWTEQPQDGYGIDAANPSSDRLQMAVVSRGGVTRDVVTGNLPASGNGTRANGVYTFGQSRRYTGGSDFFATPAALNAPNSYSWLVRAKFSAFGSTFDGIFSKNSNTGSNTGFGSYFLSNQIHIAHGNSNDTGPIGGADTQANLIALGVVTIVVTWNGTDVRYYRDGVLLGQAAYSQAVTSGAGYLKTVSNRDISTTSAEHDHTIVWSRCLTSAEALHLSLGGNSYSLFSPRRIYIPTAVAAGGLPTLTSLGISSITTTGAILTTNA